MLDKPIDLSIIVIYMIAMVGMGIWLGRGQKNINDYLLGDRNMSWWVLLISIVATETSTVTFLSIPGQGYASDYRFLQLAVGYIIGRYLVSFILLPQYFQGQLFTAYEVLHRRFGGLTKSIASALFLIMRNLSDGLRLFLAGIVLKKMLFPNSEMLVGGIDFYLSIAIIIMGVVTIFYTVIGGMKAVVWTDVVQFAVYGFGALAAIYILITSIPGGVSEIVRFAQETEIAPGHNKLSFINWDFNLEVPFTIWAGIFGGAFLSLSTHGVDQMMVQRYLSAKDQKHAARALRWSGWLVMFQFFIFLSIGIGLACFYAQQNKTFDKSDEVFSDFIINHLPTGIRGLTIAAVFAAAMSTLSSSLNSSASALVNDFYLPLTNQTKETNPERTLKLTRWVSIGFGVVQIVVAILGQYLESNVINSAMAIAGFTMGIVLGIFLLGTLTKRVDSRAATIALVSGITIMSLIYLNTNLAWPWFAVFGSVITFVIGLTASYLLPPPDQPQGALKA